MTQSEEDAFERGFHGIPPDEELRALSLVQLASLLSSSDPGSVKWTVVKEEFSRRNAAEALSIARKANIWSALATLIAAIAMYFAIS